MSVAEPLNQDHVIHIHEDSESSSDDNANVQIEGVNFGVKI